MATLPESAIDTLEIDVQSQPSLTWYIDKDNLRISGEVDGLEAVRQAAEIILNIERYRWQIFSPSSGVELEALIGNDSGYVGAELCRRINDALKMDDRITGISDFTYTKQDNILTAEFTVNTVYGDYTQEVTLQ